MTAPVGRDGELSRLRAAVSGVLAGRGGSLLVSGEPGIGKSTVVRAAVATAGARLLWVAGDELSTTFPLLPVLEALRAAPDAAAEHATLARVLHGPGADPVAAAAQLLVELVERWCAAGPVVVVVDDAHWADDATLAAWSRLSRLTGQLPLLTVAVARPVPRRPALDVLRERAGEAGRLRLGALPPAAAREVVTRLAGGRPGPRLLALTAGAGGNPLYLVELVEALRRSGRIGVADGVAEAAEGPVPPTLTAAISARLRFLPEPVRDLLRWAALLGDRCPVGQLAAVTGRPVTELAPLIEQAEAAGVLAPDEPDVAFRHALIRQALYAEFPRSTLQAWHARAARALARDGAAAEQVARQLLPAAELPDWALDWLGTTSAGLATQAAEVAVVLLDRARRQAPGADPRLSVRLADALRRSLRLAEAEAVAADTLAALPADADPDLVVDLHETLSLCRRRADQAGRRVAELEAAATRPGLTDRQRGRLGTLTATALIVAGRWDEVEPVARQALAAGTAAADRHTVGRALNALGIARAAGGRESDALDLYARGAAATAGDPALADVHLMLVCNQAAELSARGRPEEALLLVRSGCRTAERAGNRYRSVQLRQVLAELLYDTGQWDELLTEVDGTGAHAALVAVHRGDPDTAERLLGPEDTMANLGLEPQRRLAGALVREQRGDPAGALELLRPVLTENPATVEPVLTDTVRLALAAGDRDTAAAQTGTAERRPGLDRSPRRAAVAGHCRGLLDGDPEALLRAAGRYAEAGQPPARAAALLAAAVLLAGQGDPARGRVHLAEALSTFQRLGAGWEVTRATAAARLAGMPAGVRGPRRRPSTGWAALTEAELTVAELVAAGLSNPQIADRLLLSRHTVHRHVSHILAKLGAHSRVDIARERTAQAGRPR